jgi:HPt (histidine-containing phosphotransfer) domain-containing protein
VPWLVAGLALAAVWLLQLCLAPTLLVGTGPGLQTIMQALPAVLVALLALGFAALFVVVQQASQTGSSRAGVLLLHDPRLVRLVAATVMLTAAVLLLGGQVPGDGETQDWVTASTGTMLIAGVALIGAYAVVIQQLLMEYTSAGPIADRLVAELKASLADANQRQQLLRALSEVRRQAVARGDEDVFAKTLDEVTGAMHETEDAAIVAALGWHLAEAAEWADSVRGPVFQLERLIPAVEEGAKRCLQYAGRETVVMRLLEVRVRLGGAATTATATAIAEIASSAEDEKRHTAAIHALALWGVCAAQAARISDEWVRSVVDTASQLREARKHHEAARAKLTDDRWREQWPDLNLKHARDALARLAP